MTKEITETVRVEIYDRRIRPYTAVYDAVYDRIPSCYLPDELRPYFVVYDRKKSCTTAVNDCVAP
jgi:hypothetical protein